MAATPTLDRLREVASGAGIEHLGCTSADPLDGTREVLEERRHQGLNGTMQFTYKNPARSTDPRATLPAARTVLVGALSYHRHEPPAPTERGPVARVARYVWADDQQRLLDGLEAVADELRVAGHRAVVLSDQNHLVDRAVAHRAGLGWFGKNANLLVPGAGSWFIIGSVLTDAEVTAEPADVDLTGAVPTDPAGAPAGVSPVPDGCGPCTRCIPACPTGAIVAPGVIDARLCLSWTLQSTGVFPVEQRVAVGDRIYGCDECQDVCPPNRREELRARTGRPVRLDRVGDPDRAWVPTLDLLESTDDEIMERYGRWYVPERNARYLRRNALVILGNVGDGTDPRTRQVLLACIGHEDPLVRAHAVWSARRLGCDDLVVDLATDPDPMVRQELARYVPRLVGEAAAVETVGTVGAIPTAGAARSARTAGSA